MTTPVNTVNGIGPKTVEFLKKKRVTTVEGLVKKGVSLLETAPGFSPSRAANVIKIANAVLDGTYVKPVKKKSSAKPESKVIAKPEKSDKKDKKDKKKDKKLKDKKAKKDKKDKKNKKNKK
jgi:hypothetical protein